jgi:predicted molibdopterin-dependent oxidoreductase YjgC
MTRRSAALDGLEPQCFVEMSNEDAGRMKIEKGQNIKVTTRRGSLEARVRLNGRMGNGTIFIPFHFVEAAANELTIAACDPIAKIPEFKVCAARIEKS